jgi:hypothetical protein
VLLAFWDDCEAALGSSGDVFTELVVGCRAAAAAAGVRASGRAPYQLDVSYEGADFLEDWDFFTNPDPTQGCVRYVDREEASELELIGFDSATGTVQGCTLSSNVNNGS